MDVLFGCFKGMQLIPVLFKNVTKLSQKKVLYLTFLIELFRIKQLKIKFQLVYPNYPNFE